MLRKPGWALRASYSALKKGGLLGNPEHRRGLHLERKATGEARVIDCGTLYYRKDYLGKIVQRTGRGAV